MKTRTYLILNADDFGLSHSYNKAIIQLLIHKKVSSATLMPVTPGFSEAAGWAAVNREHAVGLHLTFTSEWERQEWRWASLTGKASLHGSDGTMHRNCEMVEENVREEDVAAEIAAQFNRLEEAGVRISHVDNHMGSLYGVTKGRSFITQVFAQCIPRGLGFRLPRKIMRGIDSFNDSIPEAAVETLAGLTAYAGKNGIFLPDYLLAHQFAPGPGDTYYSFKRMMVNKMANLPEGIVETYIHPSVDSDEVRNITPTWRQRVWEYELMLDPDMDYALKENGVRLVNYIEASFLR